jgi:hypothetical protein
MKIEILFTSQKESRSPRERLVRDENGILWELFGLDYCEGGIGEARIQYTSALIARCERNADLSGRIIIQGSEECLNYISFVMRKLDQ